uniref:Uncharacterized protein n=1 Tax=Oryza punctata TaxID=4537 RepID=A0A0E0M7L4_ORYPU
MAAEAEAMSHLQLQLLSLVSEHRILRERERAAREELHASSQRWKEAEEGHRREARELRAEVAARDDALRRLESRDSACSLQWTIQMKDKQIAVISEKLNAHLALFSSVGKEVAAVKQVLDDVKCLVGDKENVVSDLKGKVVKISVLEKDFVEKLRFLEEKISDYQLELRNRARMIYELRERLEAEKLNNKFQPQLEEISIFTELTSEKQAMLMELHNMEIALHKFQDIFDCIGHEVVSVNQLMSIPWYMFLMKQHSALPSPEPANANAETAVRLHGSEDIDMDDLSLAQRADSVNPNLESQNQS